MLYIHIKESYIHTFMLYKTKHSINIGIKKLPPKRIPKQKHKNNTVTMTQ